MVLVLLFGTKCNLKFCNHSTFYLWEERELVLSFNCLVITYTLENLINRKALSFYLLVLPTPSRAFLAGTARQGCEKE